MVFNNIQSLLKARPEHIEKAMKVLVSGQFYSPNELMRKAGLSLTAVKCVIVVLEAEGKLEIKKQQISPRLVVRLKDLIV